MKDIPFEKFLEKWIGYIKEFGSFELLESEDKELKIFCFGNDFCFMIGTSFYRKPSEKDFMYLKDTLKYHHDFTEKEKELGFCVLEGILMNGQDVLEQFFSVIQRSNLNDSQQEEN